MAWAGLQGRPGERRRGVDGRLEAERGDLAHAGHSYEAAADGVVVGHLSHPPIQLGEGGEERLPRLVAHSRGLYTFPKHA